MLATCWPCVYEVPATYCGTPLQLPPPVCVLTLMAPLRAEEPKPFTAATWTL